MISTNSKVLVDITQVPEIKNKNISTVLSRNMLGYLIKFCKLNTQLNLVRVNKKFRDVIHKGFYIFSDFIQVRKDSISVKNTIEIFEEEDESGTPYIVELKNRLKMKYSSLEVDDFITEIIKILLIKDTDKNGTLDLSPNFLGLYPESMKILSQGLKENQTINKLILKDITFLH